MVKVIPLVGRYGAGKSAFVDEEDYAAARKLTWHVSTQGYVVHSWTNTSKIYLHQLVLGKQQGEEVDHINGDRLDNTRANLRYVTHANNARNTAKREGTSSRFKGVVWRKDKGCWTAQIAVGGRQRHLGYFRGEEAAARAYDEAALEMHGEYARTNF